MMRFLVSYSLLPSLSSAVLKVFAGLGHSFNLLVSSKNSFLLLKLISFLKQWACQNAPKVVRFLFLFESAVTLHYLHSNV